MLLDGGVSISALTRKLSVSRQTIYVCKENRAQIEKHLSSRAEAVARWNDVMPPPLLEGELVYAARKALNDFGYWRYRYLGRKSTPWQEEAADAVMRWIASDQSELIVVNCPPGA